MEEILKDYLHRKQANRVNDERYELSRKLAYIESLMTNIFGKYLIRYYGSEAQKYVVVFEPQADTSFQDATNHKIVISLRNIVDQIDSGINPLAVAYHELAHVLYTNNKQRDTLRVEAYKELVRQHQRADMEIVHSIWNVLEDDYIESKLMSEQPFLRNIINPLKTIIGDDGLLMSWRLREYAQQPVPQELQDICDEYIKLRSRVGDNTTNKRSKIFQALIHQLVDIVLYLSNAQPNPPVDNPTKQGGDDNDDDEPTQQGGDEPTQQGGDEPIIDTILKPSTKAKTKQQQARAKMTQEEKDQLDKLNSILEKELQKVEEIMQTQLEEAEIQVAFGDQGEPIADTIFKNFFVKKLPFQIPIVLNLRNTIRNGISQAQAKAFKSDPTFKLNTPRLIESIANKSEPKVFYGKGKDASSLRKVVIFQDVSGSTEGYHSRVFDLIAYSLSSSFENSTWYLYGEKIVEKHKRDYNIPAIIVGNNVGIASCTNSWYLTKAMQRHNKDKALFVVITDGDINSLIRDEKTFNKFRDSTAFVGVLDEETQKHAKYFSTLSKEELQYLDDKYDDIHRQCGSEMYALEQKYESIMGKTRGWNAQRAAKNEVVYREFIKDTKSRTLIARLILEIVQVMKGQLR